MNLLLHRTFYVGIFLFYLSSALVRAQNNRIDFQVESGTVISTGKYAPFWFYSNQFGKVSVKNNSTYIIPSIKKKSSDSRKWDYEYCLEPVIKYDGSGDLFFHQSYIELKFQFIRLSFGTKEEIFGNQDSSLSTGFLLWSKNPRPMPKISLNLPEYIPIPFTKKYLEFKGGISHGWFDNNSQNKNVWLHHKYGNVRFGGDLPIHISYGFHHFAQWGGEMLDSLNHFLKLPHDFDTFKKVLLAKSGNITDTNIPKNEALNKIGNHLGSRQFGLDLTLKKYILSLYWQTIFEDGSGMAYRNIKDGLWGIVFQTKNNNNVIHKLLFEYINTTDQSGPSDNSTASFPRGGGNDNYFNNEIYKHGWSYHGYTIGTPLITSPAIMHNDISDYIKNNKVTAFNFGTEGTYKKANYKFVYTFCYNYGLNDYPFNEKLKESMLLLELNFNGNPIKKTNLGINLGLDFGNMYGNNYGLEIHLIRKL